MKVLSIWGPWAQLIAIGLKDVENRGWSTSYRGPMAIHCSKTGWSKADAIAILDQLVADGLIRMRTAGRIAARMEAARGKVIATVDVVGARVSDGHPSPWAMPGGHVLELARATQVLPVHVRGAQGLVNLDRAVERQLAPMLNLRNALISDVYEASESWGANCGPTALAAALGKTMAEIKPAVAPDGDFKGHMGVRDLKDAIERAGGRIVRAWSKASHEDGVDKRELMRTDGSPIIVLIRHRGPWDSVPRAAARHRHAFCFRRIYADPSNVRFDQLEHGPGWVYDVNNLVWHEDQTGRRPVVTWLPLHLWRSEVLPSLTPERGTGETVIDWMAHVAPA